MNFYVYHSFNLGLVYLLCHNISDRIIDKSKNIVPETTMALT